MSTAQKTARWRRHERCRRETRRLCDMRSFAPETRVGKRPDNINGQLRTPKTRLWHESQQRTQIDKPRVYGIGRTTTHTRRTGERYGTRDDYGQGEAEVRDGLSDNAGRYR
ncbi:Hypothetical protein CINCED_3A004322 [Cinara cedri]|uniref:Uncharacterized protein n=1 Tax=Cinara cedri TaxID=506608 RepID=A0A5E4NJY9_9HEMI|nr:Hypothetical protein CINCED_3A004322 [Cinara cedri]